MGKLEFFVGADGHVWYRTGDECRRLLPSDVETVEYILAIICRVYPAAEARLQQMFERSQPNRRFKSYKVVERFIRCNMGADNLQRCDIDGGRLNLEDVPCPLRGVCDCEGVVCRPRANSVFSKA